jgi:hypothetical protein
VDLYNKTPSALLEHKDNAERDTAEHDTAGGHDYDTDLDDDDKNVLQMIMDGGDNYDPVLQPIDDKGTAKPNDVAIGMTEGSDQSTSLPTEAFALQQCSDTIMQEVKNIVYEKFHAVWQKL